LYKQLFQVARRWIGFCVVLRQRFNRKMYFRAADQDIDADNDYVKYPFDDWYILFAGFSITLDFGMADITKPITRSLGGIWDLENPVIR
jgi:hypothetical protein